MSGSRPLPRGAQPGAARGDAARRDGVPHGRGHRRVPGRLQGHGGPAGGVRREARARHADLREHDRRHGRRRGDDRAAARGRADDDQLLAARARPDRQPRRAHPLHVRRPGARAAGGAHAAGRRPPARPDALALLRGDVPPCARACSSRCPSTAADAKGLLKAAIRDDNPVDLHRARVPLRPARRGPRRRRPRRRTSARPRIRREGDGRDDRRDLAHGADRRDARPSSSRTSTRSTPR